MRVQASTRIMALCDVHQDSQEPFSPAYIVAKQFAEDIRPDIIVVAGDWFDFDYLSKFGTALSMEKRRYQDDIDLATEELEEWRRCCRGMEFIIGNHEDRVKRYVDHFPALEGKLDLAKDLQLYGLGIGLTEYNDVFPVGKLNFTHGWYTNIYHARKHLDSMGDHLFYGHTHDHQTYIKPVRAKREAYIAMSMGCLCSKNPHWLRNRPNQWVNGIGFFEVAANGNFSPLFIPIFEGELSYGGYTWRARAAA